jgi:malonyl CoA-acyl carrier protein transacylase
MNSLEKYLSRLEDFKKLQEEMTEDKAVKRKNTPVFSGCLSYFPDAIREVAKCSFAGQQQHNPDLPLAWDRSKSGDELDALARHLLDAGTIDDDGIRHSAKVAWRGLANLQKEIERERNGEKYLENK